MAVLTQFKFTSTNTIDSNTDTINFIAKGYIEDKDTKTIYFKYENNTYKFIIDKTVSVQVNNSKYEFDLNKKTLAIIESEGFSMNASIETQILSIHSNKLNIKYTLDFVSLKGEYEITLEW